MKSDRILAALLSAMALTLVVSCGPSESPPPGKSATKPAIFQKSGDVTLGAKSMYTEQFSPLKFFDKDSKTFWHSGTAGDYGWISISFPKPFKATEFRITRRSETSNQAPVHFLLEGGTSPAFPNAESNWQVIEEVKDEQWNVMEHAYRIKNPSEHLHYRLRIVKTVSDQTHTSVAEWELK